MTDFYGLSHEQMLQMFGTATADAAAGPADGLVAVFVQLVAATDTLKSELAHLAWEGEAADSFRAWADSVTTATVATADYVSFVAIAMSDVASAIGSTVLPALSTANAQLVKSAADNAPAMTTLMAADPAAFAAAMEPVSAANAALEKDRQDTAAAMQKLAAVYDAQAGLIARKAPPQFPEAPNIILGNAESRQNVPGPGGGSSGGVGGSSSGANARVANPVTQDPERQGAPLSARSSALPVSLPEPSTVSTQVSSVPPYQQQLPLTGTDLAQTATVAPTAPPAVSGPPEVNALTTHQSSLGVPITGGTPIPPPAVPGNSPNKTTGTPWGTGIARPSVIGGLPGSSIGPRSGTAGKPSGSTGVARPGAVGVGGTSGATPRSGAPHGGTRGDRTTPPTGQRTGTHTESGRTTGTPRSGMPAGGTGGYAGPSGGSGRGTVSGPTVRTPGGPVGGTPGNVGNRPFTPGGTGLRASAPDSASRGTVGATRGGAHPGAATPPQAEQRRRARADYLEEDENTWRGDENPVPPVVG